MMKVVVREEKHQIPSTDWKAAFDAKQKEIAVHHYPRNELAEILRTYHQGLEADTAAMESVRAIKETKRSFIVTGQQLGFMGGPTYTILKALSAIQIAREVDAIPLFWLATEDHDIAEINHTYLIDSKGNIKRHHLNFPRQKLFVEDLVLSSSHIEAIEAFLVSVNHPVLLADWKIKEGMLYTEAMAKLLMKLFAGTGLLFIEPRLLRPLAKSFWEKEITQHEAILAILQKQAETLAAAGKKVLLPIGEGTQLFIKNEKGWRVKIQASSSGFMIEDKFYSADDLLRLVKESPERFSTNVAARTILQSHLIPTLAYVAGPTEQLYYEQLEDYHRFHEVPFPVVIPRISATLITPDVADKLHKAGLNPWDPLPHGWEEWVAQHPQKDPGTFTAESLHYLKNYFHPHQKPQERVLNWWGFQSQVKKNLLKECLEHVDWKQRGQQYVWCE